MAKFNVAVSKITGTVTSTETATMSVEADTADGAKRIAMQQLADDASGVAWASAPTTPVATKSGETNAAAHVTAVTPA